MEKNKSIDGLAVHRAKESRKKTVANQKSESKEEFLKPVKVFEFDKKDKKLVADTKKAEKLKKSEKKNKKDKKDKKPHKVRTTIITIILLLITLALGGFCYLCIWGTDIIAKITGGGNVFDLLTFFDEDHYEPLKTAPDGRTNILAFGTSGYNMEGDEGKGKHAGAQLTDSIMMISINQNTGDIALLSLPRDLKASPTCTATGKINEVYWCKNQKGNNEEAGAQALMAEVGSILGIEFQYYVHLNWGSLVQIVNALGGIQITLDENINDKSWTGAVYKAGETYTINGDQALGLARARHGTTGGDFSRGNSQQKILIGIKNKIYEVNLPLVDMLGLASTLGDNLRTNLTIEELKTAAHLTFEFDLETMRQINLVDYNKKVFYMTTANINGISYVVPKAGVGNYSKIQEFVAEQLKEPEPEPEPEPEETSTE